jgi:hypothetical protein
MATAIYAATAKLEVANIKCRDFATAQARIAELESVTREATADWSLGRALEAIGKIPRQ